MCNPVYTEPSAQPIRMQGKKIPAGTMVPEVMQVKANQTAKNISIFLGSKIRASFIKDLIVLI